MQEEMRKGLRGYELVDLTWDVYYKKVAPGLLLTSPPPAPFLPLLLFLPLLMYLLLYSIDLLPLTALLRLTTTREPNK